MLIYQAQQKTYLKKTLAQSSELAASQIHEIQKGQEINILASGSPEKGHVYVTLDRGYGEQGFNSWYIYEFHWANLAYSEPKHSPKPRSKTAYFTATQEVDQYGGEIFELKVGSKVYRCVSGQPYKKPCHPYDDYPGSMRPIPEGVYTVGPAEQDNRAAYRSRQDGIGPRWIVLTPQTPIGGRSGLLMHPDWN